MVLKDRSILCSLQFCSSASNIEGNFCNNIENVCHSILILFLSGIITDFLIFSRDVEFGLVGFGSNHLSYVNVKKNGKLQMKESLPIALPWYDVPPSNRSDSDSGGILLDKLWDIVDKIFIADGNLFYYTYIHIFKI